MLDHQAGYSLSNDFISGVCGYCGRDVVVACMYYHSLSSNFLTLCFGLMARDFKVVGYITLTKPGNKTGKYF